MQMSQAADAALLRRVNGVWIVTSPTGVHGRYADGEDGPTLSFHLGDATRFHPTTLAALLDMGALIAEPCAWDQHKQIIEYRVLKMVHRHS
ncbi:hypothetical protein HOT99_gp106 [Caulobacter phage CcrBL10]|uniref:Uncharacterized protein n=1 Tax=Caulobacter phage CcrBL10 TaxID=2283269 RepID=A0A385E9G3_9CAUD|nr:hypothetical protein HOT99_gp106 [Caulobacter phage CcrBL10]AXQ68511.1 hypothetical protein CcrBL10_gp307 [Caulobacter phage CcrBL10]